MRLYFKIPTKRGYWKIYFEWNQFRFYCNDKNWEYSCSLRHVQPNEIPKSILKRANCFMKDPVRFGERAWC